MVHILKRNVTWLGKNSLFLVLGLLLFVTACGNNDAGEKGEDKGSGDTDSITFVSWGGTTQDAQEEYWGKPFTEETGVKVISDQTDYGKLKAMVENGNVIWDVVDVEGDFAYQAAEDGLLEPLDFSIIDKSELDEDFVFDYGVGSFAYSFVNAYNTDAVSGELNGWESFFDTDEFKGKRTAYKWPTAGVFEMALLADGVEPEDLYPLDFDRAFAKLDEVKSDMQWWDTGAQSQQLLASGEVSMGHVWNGRMYSIAMDGAKVDIDWKHNIKAGDMLVVPKGTKNKEAAMEFIATAVSPQAQADFANETAYTPINTKSVELVDEELVDYLSSSHEETQVVLDMEYWATAIDEVLPKWNAWLLE